MSELVVLQPAGEVVLDPGRVFRVREKPPLRLSYEVKTPSGRFFQWSESDPNPANVPRNAEFSTTAPGGFDGLDLTLPRKQGVLYSDLERFSDVRALGAGGEVAGEFRLNSAARTSGNEVSVSPGCAGHQAHLEDDKTATMVYVDVDLNNWQGMSTQRKLDVINAGNGAGDGSVNADETSGSPTLELSFDGAWTTPPRVEGYYDAGPGNQIGSIYYAWKKTANVDNADSNWAWNVLASTNDILSAYDDSGNLRAAGPGTGTLTASSDRRFGQVQHLFGTFGGIEGSTYAIFFTALAVFGNHGLTKQGTASATQAQGLFASDVIAHAIGRWCPQLRFTTTGGDPSIQASGFVIPQLAFKDPTTALDILTQANRFHLRDWFVWEDKTFYYQERGARARYWRARIAPSQLQETGPRVERVWNGVVVIYQDPSGSTKTVGPLNSGCDNTDAVLADTDPDNPANQLGIKRYAVLDMGIVSTLAGGTEVGRRFLIESKQLDTSGQAQLVGTCVDDRGVEWPAWKVRAGDYISFIDAADTSYRRIVRTSYSADSRTNAIDLDAPPEGMDALLERLGAALLSLPDIPAAGSSGRIRSGRFSPLKLFG